MQHQPQDGAGSAGDAGSAIAWRWWLALALLALLPYLNAFGNAFVRDDIVIIRDNPRIRSAAGVAECFRGNYWGEVVDAGLYRPLVLATYGLNHALGGLDTRGYTAFNLLLHVAVTLLLLRLARSLGAPPLAALAAAGLFAVHPVHTESVTGFVGRADELSAVGFLLALLAHRALPTAGRRAWALRWGGALAFALGLLSKESTLPLLAVVPVMDALLPASDAAGRPVPLSARWRRDYPPLLLVALAYLVLRWVVLGSLLRDPASIDPAFNPLVPASTSALGQLRGASGPEALLTALAVLGEHARLLLWPARLSADYSFDQIPLVRSLIDPRLWLGLGVLAAVVVGAWILRRRSPVAAFGLACGALTFSVTSNLAFPFGTICAERLLYLPSAGFLLAAGVGSGHLAARFGRPVVLSGLALALVAGGARTWSRNRDWRDPRAVWESAVAACPDSFKAHSSLGITFQREADRAREAGDDALVLQLATRAAQELERALEILPEHLASNQVLADTYWLLGRGGDALPVYERLARLDPGDARLPVHQASALLQQASRRPGPGREALLRRAEQKLDEALARDPSSAEAWRYRGILYQDYRGDARRAARAFAEVLRLQPDHPERETMMRLMEQR